MGHTYSVQAISLNYDNTKIVSGSWDDTIKLWDVASGECEKTFVGHADGIESVAFSHDGTKLVSGSRDNTIKLWDVASGTCERTFEGHENMVASVAFDHAGTKIISGSWDNTIRLWDAASGDCIKTLRQSVDYAILSHDDTKIVAASIGSIRIIDVDSGIQEQILSTESIYNAVHSIALNQDCIKIVSGGKDGSIKLWGY